jgi:hypothetical protein
MNRRASTAPPKPAHVRMAERAMADLSHELATFRKVSQLLPDAVRAELEPVRRATAAGDVPDPRELRALRSAFLCLRIANRRLEFLTRGAALSAASSPVPANVSRGGRPVIHGRAAS